MQHMVNLVIKKKQEKVYRRRKYWHDIISPVWVNILYGADLAARAYPTKPYRNVVITVAKEIFNDN